MNFLVICLFYFLKQVYNAFHVKAMQSMPSWSAKSQVSVRFDKLRLRQHLAVL